MTHLRFTLLVLTMTAALAAPAAFDLTGTWTGTRKDLFGGAKEKFKEPATLRITQTGNQIGIVAEITGAGTTTTRGSPTSPPPSRTRASSQ